MPEPKSAAQMVAQAKGRVENLTPEQVAAEVERGGAILVNRKKRKKRRKEIDESVRQAF
jgi:hypothetical protein